MKDLYNILKESLLDDEEVQLDKLEWVNANFTKILDSKTEDEFNRNYDLFKMKIYHGGKRVPMKGILLPRESNKKYIMFLDKETSYGNDRMIRYGTSSRSYYIRWNNTLVTNLQAPRGIRDYSHLGKKHEVYYIPDEFKKEYNKVIKMMQ